ITPPYHDNPQTALEARGDVMKIAAGCYGLQGNFLQVCKNYQAQVMALAQKYSAIEQEFPPLWPIELFKSINYFSDYPHQVILTTTPQENHATRAQFAADYHKNQSFERIEMNSAMEPAAFGLAPMVCGCCYFTLRNRRGVTNTIYTTYNKVFRNERSTIDSLDRLTVFSVRDIVFVGDSDFVLQTRQQLIDDLCALLQQWGIESKIETANDPFFSNDAIYKNIYQYKHRTKYELLARLPFCDRYIAIGSINLHQEYSGKTFDIQTPEGHHAHSGCIGVGFERLTYALYSQYGPDERQWPAEIARPLGF
ncbi:MAG: hypothetical protein FD130_1724, partial [Halothiobacillaceae bacterium]